MSEQLTKNFTLKEFTTTSRIRWKLINYYKIKHNRKNTAFYYNILAFATELQKLRNYLGRPIVINSGYRCPGLNRAVKGSESSDHTLGQAVDFIVPGYTHGEKKLELIEIITKKLKLNFHQLINEYPENKSGGWIHMSYKRPNKKEVKVITNNKKIKGLFAKWLTRKGISDGKERF